jgi:hypothetical protein
MTTVEDPGGEDLKVTPPKQGATAVPAVTYAMQYSLEQTSLRASASDFRRGTADPAAQSPTKRAQTGMPSESY